jgi:hypothetical protein
MLCDTVAARGIVLGQNGIDLGGQGLLRRLRVKTALANRSRRRLEPFFNNVMFREPAASLTNLLSRPSVEPVVPPLNLMEGFVRNLLCAVFVRWLNNRYPIGSILSDADAHFIPAVHNRPEYAPTKLPENADAYFEIAPSFQSSHVMSPNFQKSQLLCSFFWALISRAEEQEPALQLSSFRRLRRCNL